MPAAPTDPIVDFLLGLGLSTSDPAAGNRFIVEGITFAAAADGTPELRIRKLEAAALRFARGPLTLDVDRVALHDVVALVRTGQGRPRLASVQAASADLTGVQVHGPLTLPPQAAGASVGASAWSLAPLAGAEGSLRAEIVDAHLLFDAEVTVPVRQGAIDFKDATVEHVGPDSRMGASRLGLYVDAPNGRSYLYQFPTAPVPGVTYEKRGAMLGPWVTDRGGLQLQAFAEWLLRQEWGGHLSAVTEQARLLFDRTAVAGELRLGDGHFAAPGVQAEFAGRAEGRNTVRLHSEAVGRGLSLEMPGVALRGAAVRVAGMQANCDEVTAGLSLRIAVEGTQLRFAFALAQLNAGPLRVTVG